VCGRFTSLLAPELLAVIYEVFPPEHTSQRYNIAPTQQVAIVRESIDASRSLSSAHWGLIPHWAKDRSIGSRMINARSETVHEKPAFRQAIKTRRCIIPASGFYEWTATPVGKQPYYITMRDGSPFSFAGIWDSWTAPDGSELESCSILTTSANTLMASIHDRMPVILYQGEFDRWLDPGNTDPRHLQHFYQPYPPELMTAWQVSRQVNSASHNAADCIQAIEPS